METYLQKSINCCFCDQNLTPGYKSDTKQTIRYRCPACERIYCSANCSSGHKEKFSCSGVRSRTPYISRAQFDQKQFLDDYFFLEEVNKKIETAQRTLPTLKLKTKANNNKRRRSKKKNWKSKSKGQISELIASNEA